MIVGFSCYDFINNFGFNNTGTNQPAGSAIEERKGIN
jgi:hypothetical protein